MCQTRKYKNTNTQIHKYTNTAYDELPERPNMWRIFEKKIFQGYQKSYSHMSKRQIEKYKHKIQVYLFLFLLASLLETCYIRISALMSDHIYVQSAGQIFSFKLGLALLLLHPEDKSVTVRSWARAGLLGSSAALRLLPLLLGCPDPAGAVVANLALGAAEDQHMWDVLGQVEGGGDEGQDRVGLVLLQAG